MSNNPGEIMSNFYANTNDLASLNTRNGHNMLAHNVPPNACYDFCQRMNNEMHKRPKPNGGRKEMSYAARKYPLFVNEFFMKRVNSFMKTVMKHALQIEHYWGRVEFAPGRGAIHLHVVAIAKDRAYLQDFYKATTMEEKAKVLNEYAIKHLDMTADAKVRTQLRDEIRRIQIEVGTTTLFVTHDQEEAMALADPSRLFARSKIEKFPASE